MDIFIFKIPHFLFVMGYGEINFMYIPLGLEFNSEEGPFL